MLIDLQNWEDQADDIVNEVVQQMLIALINLDQRLVLRRERRVRVIKEIEIDWLFGESFLAMLEI